jgi:WhiB family redox-sensing transcriptional regulator
MIGDALDPRTHLWEWQQHGLCRRLGSHLFFHPEGERGSARRARQEIAKAVCARCPVLTQCREHALRVAEPYGVWGGMSEDERAGYGREAEGR